jgi:hypothetical protein
MRVKIWMCSLALPNCMWPNNSPRITVRRHLLSGKEAAKSTFILLKNHMNGKHFTRISARIIYLYSIKHLNTQSTRSFKTICTGLFTYNSRRSIPTCLKLSTIVLELGPSGKLSIILYPPIIYAIGA